MIVDFSGIEQGAAGNSHRAGQSDDFMKLDCHSSSSRSAAVAVPELTLGGAARYDHFGGHRV